MIQGTLFPDPAPIPTPRKETRNELLDRLCSETLAQCEQKGVSPRQLLLEIKFREVEIFLQKFLPEERLQFATKLFISQEGDL